MSTNKVISEKKEKHTISYTTISICGISTFSCHANWSVAYHFIRQDFRLHNLIYSNWILTFESRHSVQPNTFPTALSLLPRQWAVKKAGGAVAMATGSPSMGPAQINKRSLLLWHCLLHSPFSCVTMHVNGILAVNHCYIIILRIYMILYCSCVCQHINHRNKSHLAVMKKK